MPRGRKNKMPEDIKENDSINGNGSERKKKKKNPETSQRLRNIIFAVIVVLLLAVIGSMVATNLLPEYPILSLPSRAIAKVMQPVQNYFSNGTGWLVNYVKRLKLRSNIEYEYEQLYEKYDVLLSETMMINELQQQLNEYRELADEMETHSQFSGVPAKVIATDSTNYFSTLELNVGKKQGVQDYMAVVKSGGLVGYTYDVTETTAKVQTIINSDTSIPALIESTRYQGTIKGTLGINGEPTCRMYYLSENHLPRQGDIVVTSGVGVEFPKGIPIGTVRESTRGMEEGKTYVVIEPIVDFERVEYVIVYRYIPSYPEQAEKREESDIIYTGLPTARPVPTFAISSVSGFAADETPFAENETENTDLVETGSPSYAAGEDPEQTDAVVELTEIDESRQVGNLSYEDVPGTPTPVPTATPQPSPTPVPTFSLTDLTQEREDGQ